jgi:hypothetical protein
MERGRGADEWMAREGQLVEEIACDREWKE